MLKEFYEKTKDDYKYYVKACDKFMSYWGLSEKRKNIIVIICKDNNEMSNALTYLRSQSNFNYIDWNYYKLDNLKNVTRGKTYTITNKFNIAHVGNDRARIDLHYNDNGFELEEN